MSVRQNIARRRPDGGHGPSDGMAHHPDGRTSAASNFLIRLRVSGPWGMSIRTAELQHAIFLSAMCVSGP
jgi:hypothetical protein